MSFLPSSQETTLYSRTVILCYYTNWQRVLTFAQSLRFVFEPFSTTVWICIYFHTCTFKHLSLFIFYQNVALLLG